MSALEYMRAHAAKKVTAVILTHNRLEGAVKRCTEVTGQTRPVEEIVLVDNASSNGTAEEIERRFPQVTVLRLPDNLGPAGGFAAGFTQAMKRPCDFIWAIDDDVVLSSRCLEYLLEDAEAPPPRVIFPTRLPLDQKHGVAWRGILVPAEIVRAVGVPRADLFWHVEDTEYFIHRIRDEGGFGLTVSAKATVWHGAHRPRKGFPGWKLYYQARNSVYYRFYLRKRGRLKSVTRLLARLVVIFFREERGPAKAWMMVRGIKDGSLGILGKTVDPKGEPPSAYYRESAAERQEEEEELKRWERESGLAAESQVKAFRSSQDVSGDPET